MWENVFAHINRIVLYGSSDCNLKCGYCFHCNSAVMKEYDSIIQNAWETHTYIPEVLKTLNICGVDADKITNCCFVGGEPFLHPEGISTGIQDVLGAFPSLDTLHFLTNLSSIDGILNVLKKIFQVATKSYKILLLCSVDGPDGSPLQYQGHLVPWSILEKNIQKLVDFFAQYSQKQNLDGEDFMPIQQLKLCFHSTVGAETYIEYFSEDKNIIEYLNFIQEKSLRLSEILNVKPLEFSFSLPSIARPYKCTSEEGEKISSILRKWDRLKMNFYQNSCPHIADVLYPSYIDAFFLRSYTRMADRASPLCSGPRGELSILPDGTLISCYLLTVPYLQNKQLFSRAAYETFDLENCQDDIEWELMVKYSSGLLGLNLLYGLIDELALSGQIPFKYFGNYSLKRDAALSLCVWDHCSAKHIEETGSIFMPYAGKIRMLLNGALDYINELSSDTRNRVLTKFPWMAIDKWDNWE